MVGRNDRCPCGSGIKFKKCCLQLKERSTQINFNFNQPERLDNIRIDPITGEIAAYSGNLRISPKSVTAEQSYKRSGDKPNKVISKTFGLQDAFFAQPVKSLNKFDCVYAVDTNYKTLHGVKVCVAGITRGNKLNIVVPDKTAYRISLKYGLMFSTTLKNPERVAWGFVADQARYWENLEDKNVGMIVDSELAILDKISDRSEALYESIYLPQNYRIMYASADSESGNPMNAMVKRSDKGASILLNELIDQLGSHDVSKYPIQLSLWSFSQKENQMVFSKAPIVQSNR